MYKQVLDPVAHSLGWSSVFAILPLLVLFILLGVVRMKAQWASLITLGVAILVALIVYSMPVGQAADSALEGAVFGFWPIMWIVINALWIYNMSDRTGHFAVLRRAFAEVSDDVRVQVVVIAFCFGALLEALAGFGTPVAICGVMLMGIGLSPMRAAAVALVADTAPGRVRRDRDADHHAGAGIGPAHARPQPDGRAPDAVPGAAGPVHPGVHGRRPPRPARDAGRRR